MNTLNTVNTTNKTLLLQDIRKKATKQAYINEVKDCSHDVIEEFGGTNYDLIDIRTVSDYMLSNVFDVEYNYDNNKKRYPNLHYRVTEWVKDRMTFGCYTYPICEWLVENELVSEDFIPKNKDLTIRMQEAAERHFQYIAKTLLDNASQEVYNSII